eukprot:4953939-Pleurochrysis_carterae.AAC.1
MAGATPKSLFPRYICANFCQYGYQELSVTLSLYSDKARSGQSHAVRHSEYSSADIVIDGLAIDICSVGFAPRTLAAEVPLPR